MDIQPTKFTYHQMPVDETQFRVLNPRVSVVIPAYNRARTLSQTLDSVLSQTEPSFEVILVDDGSTDDTRDVVSSWMADKRFPLKYVLCSSNRGPGYARNAGIEYAVGEWIAFLDSDDQWDKGFLSAMLDVGEASGENFVYCFSQMYDTYREPRHVFDFNPYDFPTLLRSDGMIPTGSYIFRRNCWKFVGPFRTDFKRGEDLEWMLRFGELHRFAVVPQVLHHYFRSEGGIMVSYKDQANIEYGFEQINNTKRAINERMRQSQPTAE